MSKHWVDSLHLHGKRGALFATALLALASPREKLEDAWCRSSCRSRLDPYQRNPLFEPQLEFVQILNLICLCSQQIRQLERVIQASSMSFQFEKDLKHTLLGFFLILNWILNCWITSPWTWLFLLLYLH